MLLIVWNLKAREKTDGIPLLGKNIRVDFSLGERDFAPNMPTTTLVKRQHEPHSPYRPNHYYDSSTSYKPINHHYPHYDTRYRDSRYERDVGSRREKSRSRSPNQDSFSYSSNKSRYYERDYYDHQAVHPKEERDQMYI